MDIIDRKRMLLRLVPALIVGYALGHVGYTTVQDYVLHRRGPNWHEFVPSWEAYVGFVIGAPIGILVFLGVRALWRDRSARRAVGSI
jgi:hypothetical protein